MKTTLQPVSQWLPTGWRRMAIMNVALITISLFVLLGVLICAVTETGDIKQPWRLYEADCGTTAKVNVLLHLLVNIFSTIVLASSNFFMQVLNAPTRKEVDSAHGQGKWLNIGISSFRNAFCLSRFKMLAWFSLLLTSVPLHVLFNSSIFLIDSRMGDFRVTIATEEFLHGGSYFLPGASLIAQEVLPDPWGTNHNADRDKKSFLRFPEYRDFGNRNLIPSFRDLADNNFSTETIVVSDIADQASGWRRLDTPACRQMYTNMSCSGLRGYRNLVTVAQGSGWIRSDIWNLSAATDGFLAPIVPRSVPNHLWFSTQCQMQGSVGWDKYPLCLSDCTKLLPDVPASEQKAPQEPWSLNPRDWYAPKPSHWWNGSLPSSLEDFSDSGNRFKLDSLNISHCLVEPRNTTCTVALSKPLLLAVVSSILLKAVTCAIALRCLGLEQPLVTPGDAISSFISKPIREISVLGLLTQTAIRQRKQEVDTERTPIYQPLLPKQWAQKKHRQTAAVPFDVWVTTYAVLSSGIIGMLIWFLYQVTGSTPLRGIKIDAFESASLLQPVVSGSAFIFSVLVVNIPQLFVSFWYIVYNSLWTRLEMSWEWDSYSIQYRPLRVTQPKKQQTSTYRLQLPYKISIPLALSSTLSHWLLSNALFIIVSQGTYFQTGSDIYHSNTTINDTSLRTMKLVENTPYQDDKINLPGDAIVAIGTSSLPVLLLLIILSIMFIIPILLSRKPLPGYMPVVGANSLAILAACQISPLSRILRSLDGECDTSDSDTENLVVSPDQNSENEESDSGVRDMVFYRLKWGEVRMPEEWYHQQQSDHTDGGVGHLSFGSVFDDPRPPIDGRWYN